MARTIAISDEVYELLKKTKMPGESFSTIIKRSLKKKGRLSDIVGSGTISLEEWKEVSALLTKAQEKTIRDLTRR